MPRVQCVYRCSLKRGGGGYLMNAKGTIAIGAGPPLSRTGGPRTTSPSQVIGAAPPSDLTPLTPLQTWGPPDTPAPPAPCAPPPPSRPSALGVHVLPSPAPSVLALGP